MNCACDTMAGECCPTCLDEPAREYRERQGGSNYGREHWWADLAERLDKAAGIMTESKPKRVFGAAKADAIAISKLLAGVPESEVMRELRRAMRPWAEDGLPSWVLGRVATVLLVVAIVVGVLQAFEFATWFAWWQVLIACVACAALGIATDKLGGENENDDEN